MIMKRDVNNVFKKISLAPHHRWLLGIKREGRYYNETCLLFGLATTLFIFNLFTKALHSMILSFLKLILCYYLDDLVAIFRSDISPKKLVIKANVYIWLTDLSGFS